MKGIVKTFRPVYRRGNEDSLVFHLLCLIIVSITCLPFAAGVANAATYYLDAVNGDDSKDGSSDNPWKTLSKAQSIVSEGDTVKLRDGNYGTFSDSTGNRSGWITWKADDGHDAVNMVNIYLGQWDGPYNMYLRFEGINVIGGPKPGEGGNNAVKVYFANYVEYINVTVSGTADYSRGDQSAGIYLFNADHIKIKDCTIHGFREQITGAANTDNYDILIEGCYLYDGFWPILAFGKNWIVRNNEFTDVWDGINMDCHDSVIEYNYIHDFKPPTPKYHGDGIQIYNHTAYGYWPENITIRGNIINTGSHHSLGLRCSVDRPGINIIVENNIAYNTTSTNVSLIGLSGLILRNNTFPEGLVNIDKSCDAVSLFGNLFYRCDVWDATSINYEDYNILYQWWAHTDPGAFRSSPTHTIEYGAGGEASFKANFVNWDADDFHLTAGSDAIDFCLLNKAPATDLQGNTRVDMPDVGNEVTAYADAGCYEYSLTDSNDSVPALEERIDNLTIDNLWMYQNLPSDTPTSYKTSSNLTVNVSITHDPLSNSSYTYEWEFVLPSDVSVAPITVAGGETSDEFWTFAARGCDEPAGLSDAGQTLKVKVTITGNDYGNTGAAEAEFGIALLGDVNNDGVVNVADQGIINAFWRKGAAGRFTLRDCDVNCDGVVNMADLGIANVVFRGTLGQNSVSAPCPLR